MESDNATLERGDDPFNGDEDCIVLALGRAFSYRNAASRLAAAFLLAKEVVDILRLLV